MTNTLTKILKWTVLFAIVFALSLPSILQALGLHPEYHGPTYQLPGKRALVITTSHGVLNIPGETGGEPTGVMASEMTHPYYGFTDAGMQVDIASIKGGQIPVDPQTLGRVVKSPEDDRYLADPILQAKVNNSLLIDDIDFTDYDAIFLSGGWGAAYDLGYSEVLAEKISAAYYAETPIIGSVCHGALGLINDKQIKQLGIEVTPQHPEAELRKAGAIFEAETRLIDFFATHVVVDDERRFVTGQNQNSGHETAHQMMAIIAALD